MGDRSLTLFEVHLHDGLSFSATNTSPAIGVGDDESEGTEIDVEDDETAFETAGDDESAGVGNGVKVLIGLVLVAGLAVAARKLMGTDDLEELEELDDLAAEA
ncbi:hypothetical protein [Salinirubrum litoreum]|uniref:Uncharacterized protein n=1 Tax=Salinirubrum litoreum TaxID=1126234 RepID=A0ABD5R815_9EURY|nr:hypothetical protein [Salinirubrum litoreum]